jgi:hypothetical protein
MLSAQPRKWYSWDFTLQDALLWKRDAAAAAAGA